MKRNFYVSIFCVVIVLIVLFIGAFDYGRYSRVNAYAVDMAEIQTRLSDLGYYNGVINGLYDDATVVAIKNFQRDNGIYVSGAVGGVTANALGIYMSQQESNDLYLLAKCIHAEARGESYVGQVAVGAVILNRVASPDFPDTIYSFSPTSLISSIISSCSSQISPTISSRMSSRVTIPAVEPNSSVTTAI